MAKKAEQKANVPTYKMRGATPKVVNEIKKTPKKKAAKKD